jgi:arginyl-tRNA synthetase
LIAEFLKEQVKLAIAQYIAQYGESLGLAKPNLAEFLARSQLTPIIIKPCYPRFNAHYSCPVAFNLANDLNALAPQTQNQLLATPDQYQGNNDITRSPTSLPANITPAKIAQDLSNKLNNLSDRLAISCQQIESERVTNQKAYRAYAVEAIDGHLNFRLSDRYIANCLNAYLNDLTNFVTHTSKTTNSQSLTNQSRELAEQSTLPPKQPHSLAIPTCNTPMPVVMPCCNWQSVRV